MVKSLTVFTLGTVGFLLARTRRGGVQGFKAAKGRQLMRIWLQICGLALSLAWAVPVYGDVLFSENFQGYSAGSSLAGQGGWVSLGGDLSIGDSANLASRVETGNGSASASGFADLEHALSHALDPSQVTEMSFDAFAGSAAHNAATGLNRGMSTDYNGVYWFPTTHGSVTTPSWVFDARGITGDSSDAFVVSGGFNEAIHLSIVLDGSAGTVSGFYDFGSGPQFAASYAASATAIGELDTARLSADFRFGDHGLEIDNILVRSTASTVPEPATSALLGSALAMLAAWRIRRRSSS